MPVPYSYVSIEKVIAIQNWGCSGTTLMHSLLDEHTNIASLPLLHARTIYIIWEKLSSEDLCFETIVNALSKEMAYLFDAKNPGNDPSLRELGEAKDKEIAIDEKTFFRHLKNILPPINTLTRKQFVVSFFLAYNACFERQFTAESYICFPIHALDKKYAQYLVEDFREAYFLHMAREPVQNMGSIMKHINHHQIILSFHKGLLTCAFSEVALGKMIHWGKSVFAHGKLPYFPNSCHNNRTVSSRYIRLEDVHQMPEKTMSAICRWLDLSWEETLLKSTVMGHTWHNRKESIRATGFNTKTSQQKHNTFLSNFDKYRLTLITWPEQRYFNYKTFSSKDRLFLYVFPFLSLWPFKVAWNKKRFMYRLRLLTGFIKRNSGFFAASSKFNPFIFMVSPAVALLLLAVIPYNYVNLRYLFVKKWLQVLTQKKEEAFVIPCVDNNATPSVLKKNRG